MCWNSFISGIDDYVGRKVFIFLALDFICMFGIGFIRFIVLWDIVHAAFLQLLVCNESRCVDVEHQRISQVS
jgi:hypothetical protein